MAASKRKIKTVATATDPKKFIATIEGDAKRADSYELVEMMQEITGEPAKMWGSSIIGFGLYRYTYASGHSGEMCMTGFSPRSAALVLYLGPGIENETLMAKLGKHKTGKGCLYVNKLDDVDRKVLRKLIEHSVKRLRKRGPS
ncbi:MAG TPA: DUF1801 domain-containing protein [Gammaproteobacteria bacterium]|nr:DUF1801 domain-containing protein [Gammaproteobacteria bacterium]